MLWEYWSSCEKHDAAASVSVAKVMWTYKGDVNSALGGNSKEPSSSTVSAETSFDEDSNNETLNVYNVLPAIIDKKIEYKLYSNVPAHIPNIIYPNITCNPNSTILIMLFFGFPILSHPIQPYTTSIGYTNAYAKSSQSNLLSCYIQVTKPYVGKKYNHKKRSL